MSPYGNQRLVPTKTSSILYYLQAWRSLSIPVRQNRNKRLFRQLATWGTQRVGTPKANETMCLFISYGGGRKVIAQGGPIQFGTAGKTG